MFSLALACAPAVLVISAPPSVAAPPPVSYTAKVFGNSAALTISTGSIQLASNELRVMSAGAVLARLPLSFHLNDKLFPIDATVSGNTATLTPSVDVTRAVAARPVTAPAAIAAYKNREERDKAAFSQMRDQIGFSVTMGAIIGAVLAATAGCLVGGAVALPSAVLTAVFGPLAGCVAGAVVMAPVGGIIGTLFVAAPVAVLSTIQYFNTVNAPL